MMVNDTALESHYVQKQLSVHYYIHHHEERQEVNCIRTIQTVWGHHSETKCTNSDSAQFKWKFLTFVGKKNFFSVLIIATEAHFIKLFFLFTNLLIPFGRLLLSRLRFKVFNPMAHLDSSLYHN